MKVIIAATPVPGHLNPLLSACRLLVDAGHEVRVITGLAFRAKVEAAGAMFHPLAPAADLDIENIDVTFPERKLLSPGPEQIRFDCEKIFIETIPAQFQSIEAVLDVFAADLILVDTIFGGALPYMLGARANRPAVATLGITCLPFHRDDHGPMPLGFPFTTDSAEIERYRAIESAMDEGFSKPVRAKTDAILKELGASALPMYFFDALVALPDIYLQPTVTSFEYPRVDLPVGVHFIGAMPPPMGLAITPEVQAAIDSNKRLVLVTQGTIANFDLGQLLAPTIKALADRDDVIVLATTGGRPIADIPADIPSNCIALPFLPFGQIMPHVDVLVTNGGYGTVCHALSLGIPVVVAGTTEEKPEIAARVTWSGAGIDLHTESPEPTAVAEAVNSLLSEAGYKEGAERLAVEFAKMDAPKEMLRLLEDLVEAHRRLHSGRQQNRSQPASSVTGSVY